jgi:hypothetical protein
VEYFGLRQNDCSPKQYREKETVMHAGTIRRFALVPLAALTLGVGFLTPSASAAPLDSPELSVMAQCARTPQDLDGDCRPNGRDRDIDGDGISNRRDRDVDGDGISNRRDRDIDGDGRPNNRDRDMDGDGRPNGRDRDRDGDGRPNGRDNTPNGRGGRR